MSKRVQLDVSEYRDKAEATGFAGLLSEVQRSTYRSLGWVAAVVAGLQILRLLQELTAEGAAGPAWITVVLLAGSLATFWLSRAGRLPPSRFPTLAITFEIFVGLGLGAQVLNWQNLVGDHGWALGGVPAVAVWVIFFANIVALPPAAHLFGAILSTLPLPIFFFLSLSLFEVPSNIGPQENLRVFGQLMIPVGIAIALAYVSARRVYGLSFDLSEARRLGNYQLTERLGEGGMGEVWKARHHMLARPAAIKLIRADVAGGAFPAETLLQRFEQEVQATANLRSPHTIEVYDYGRTDDGTFYYVMELLDGIDLEELVQEHGPQPVERVVHILRQACHSLGEAHHAGMVHRDIKPANIFLCRYGRDVDFVKILDFGMVKQDLGDAGLTQMGTFAGTAHFAAPEVAQGLIDQIDSRADIYALGCVAFWLLTGRRVFGGETAMKVLVRHIHDQPEPPSHLAQGIGPDMDRLVLDCLEKDPEKRVPSMDDLIEKLSAIVCPSWTFGRATSWWDDAIRTKSSST
jgi:serine/threonine-protein kinase